MSYSPPFITRITTKKFTLDHNSGIKELRMVLTILPLMLLTTIILSNELKSIYICPKYVYSSQIEYIYIVYSIVYKFIFLSAQLYCIYSGLARLESCTYIRESESKLSREFGYSKRLQQSFFWVSL